MAAAASTYSRIGPRPHGGTRSLRCALCDDVDVQCRWHHREHLVHVWVGPARSSGGGIIHLGPECFD
jgi:hypothetical protein